MYLYNIVRWMMAIFRRFLLRIVKVGLKKIKFKEILKKWVLKKGNDF